ncbi:FMN-binding negative transcriptional regulator [Amycolatopsis sp. NPDC058340]|uniref:FMN-binding negative transcriptional regulator n=1 Tax=Amycolatopsis sp. NPDC058340 TaxID=3346453 RepID=UPI00365D7E18
MFVPKIYQARHREWSVEVVRNHPLATLIGNGPDGLLATHLPAIAVPETLAGGMGDTGLVGVTFLGHLNRANPHWRAIREGGEALLVFQGPNGYISPAVYKTVPAAPTWNFVSVHAHGEIGPIESRDETLEVVKATVRAFERDHGTSWDMTGSLSYFEKIVPAVGAFRFVVTAAEGMFKLSQEKKPGVRAMVADAFAGSDLPERRRVADIMRRWVGR